MGIATLKRNRESIKTLKKVLTLAHVAKGPKELSCFEKQTAKHFLNWKKFKNLGIPGKLSKYYFHLNNNVLKIKIWKDEYNDSFKIEIGQLHLEKSHNMFGGRNPNHVETFCIFYAIASRVFAIEQFGIPRWKANRRPNLMIVSKYGWLQPQKLCNMF